MPSGPDAPSPVEGELVAVIERTRAVAERWKALHLREEGMCAELRQLVRRLQLPLLAQLRLEFAQQLNAEEKQYFRLTLGLFGKDAPVATAQFKALCAGTLAVPCEPEPR